MNFVHSYCKIPNNFDLVGFSATPSQVRTRSLSLAYARKNFVGNPGFSRQMSTFPELFGCMIYEQLI